MSWRPEVNHVCRFVVLLASTKKKKCTCIFMNKNAECLTLLTCASIVNMQTCTLRCLSRHHETKDLLLVIPFFSLNFLALSSRFRTLCENIIMCYLIYSLAKVDNYDLSRKYLRLNNITQHIATDKHEDRCREIRYICSMSSTYV